VPIDAPAACIHHPDREAMGICVRCRVRYCSECITKLDGVNFCAGCLGAMASAGAPSDDASRELGWLGRSARAALFFVLLSALAWVMVEAVFPGRT
jgi:hypothetical protein